MHLMQMDKVRYNMIGLGRADFQKGECQGQVSEDRGPSYDSDKSFLIGIGRSKDQMHPGFFRFLAHRYRLQTHPVLRFDEDVISFPRRDIF